MLLSELNPAAKRERTARVAEIITTFAKYGLADWIKEDSPEFLRRYFRDPDGGSLSRYSTAERARLALTELGTTWIKLGQMLSTRADLVGPEVAAELSLLQGDVPADPPDSVRAIIEVELGKSPAELYASFTDTPLGSASIGQVHAATLLEGDAHDASDQVVVKVQHADIRPTIEQDLSIMEELGATLEQHSDEAKLYRLQAVAAEFGRSLLRELDFTQEANNLRRFEQHFLSQPTVHFPSVEASLSAERVLTMERLAGYPLSKSERLAQESRDTAPMAEVLANVWLDMIFRDGLYHADPHPGNIHLLPDGRLGILDCGTVGTLDEGARAWLGDIILALMQRDAAQITELVIRVGMTPPELDRDAMQAAVARLLIEQLDPAIGEPQFGPLVESIMAIIREHHIVLPTSITLLGKVLVQLDGTLTKLGRDFRLMDVLRPYTLKILEHKLSPALQVKKAMRTVGDWQYLVESFPREVSATLAQVRKGEVEVRLVHSGLDQVTNRLVEAVLASALFLGSVRLLSNDVPPLVGGLSALGLLGTLGALLLARRTLKKIKQSGGS